jgi:tRNA(Arg) A34 adenosine deaminase TadA
MRLPPISLRLPNWVDEFINQQKGPFLDDEQRLALAIELARLNVLHRTGGPFGAAIFETQSGRLVAVGVNVVEAQTCSIAHAEMMAIAGAQQSLGCYDLGGSGLPDHELVTSAEPCAMCLGAIPWSGVRRVVCGARDEDARAIGFDEGNKPAGWTDLLEKQGIAVVQDVLRDRARQVLLDYAGQGGVIYNPQRADDKPLAP